MKVFILFVMLVMTSIYLTSCTTEVNKFCVWSTPAGKKCLQLGGELTEQRCKDSQGTPSKDCGK